MAEPKTYTTEYSVIRTKLRVGDQERERTTYLCESCGAEVWMDDPAYKTKHSQFHANFEGMRDNVRLLADEVRRLKALNSLIR